jgi:hypothetical protein
MTTPRTLRLSSPWSPLIAGLVVFFATLPCVVSGQQPSSENPVRTARQSTWDFFVARYGWLTGVEGTVVTDGEELGIKIPFDDFAANT